MTPFIVAEISKNWPNTDQTPIHKLFEIAINTNHERGYRLINNSFDRLTYIDASTGKTILNETIIAVFEKMTSKPKPPRR